MEVFSPNPEKTKNFLHFSKKIHPPFGMTADQTLESKIPHITI